MLNFPISPNEIGGGKLITFISVVSGVGASTLACHTALSFRSFEKVKIVDFNLESKVRAYLKFPEEVTKASILDLKSATNPESIHSAGEEYSENLQVIPGVLSRMMDKVDVNSELIIKIASFLKRSNDFNIAVSGELHGPSFILPMLSDLIFVVVRPDRTSMDSFREQIDFLVRLGCQDRIKIILNQSQSPGGIIDAEKFFVPDIIIPYSADIIRQCNKRDLKPDKKFKNEIIKVVQDYFKEEENFDFNIDKLLLGMLAVKNGLLDSIDSMPINDSEIKKEETILPEEVYKILRNEVRGAVQTEFSLGETDPVQARDPIIKNKFNNIVRYQIDKNKIQVLEINKNLLAEQLFSDILGYGPLEKYFNDPLVNEILVYGTRIEVEKEGISKFVPETFESVELGVDLLRRMLAKTGGRIDQATPEVKARLHDGSRLIAQIDSIAPREKLLITIRRFLQNINKDKLLENKSISRPAMAFLEAAVKAKINIMIAGSTSSGKTTWLNVLGSFIPVDERIITVEDPIELQLPHPKVRSLEYRAPNIEGKGEYTLSDAVKAALRMAPTRIVLGEVRGKEAQYLLQAMGTGHDGSIGTGHANSALDMLEQRMPDMLAAHEDLRGATKDVLLDKVANRIELVLFVTKDKKRRRLDHIVEVLGVKKDSNGKVVGIETNLLYEYNASIDDWEWVAKDFKLKERLVEQNWTI